MSLLKIRLPIGPCKQWFLLAFLKCFLVVQSINSSYLLFPIQIGLFKSRLSVGLNETDFLLALSNWVFMLISY